MTMVTVKAKPVGLQEWQAAKTEFAKAVKQAVHAGAPILKTRHQELNILFKQAQKELTAMGQARACNSSSRRLWSISFVDTAVFTAGAVGFFLSDTEIAKDYPWLKTASLCAIAAAHCLSKVNDVWNYVGIGRSKRELELTLIVRDGLFLKAANALTHLWDRESTQPTNDWNKEKEEFLEFVGKKDKTVAKAAIGMTEEVDEGTQLLNQTSTQNVLEEYTTVTADDETTV